jgi:O-antigen ligase
VRSIGAITICALVGLTLLAATNSLGFLQSRSRLETYDQQRFSTQTEALQRASQHILGYGPGQSEVELTYSTHSLYARVAYEQGFIGEALLIAIIGATLLAAIGLAARDRDLHGVGSAALLGSWLGLLANSFFVDTLHWRHLWIFAALIWCASFLHSEEASNTAPLRYPAQ